jgi:hypothetical protein
MANQNEIELFISDDGELKVHIKGMKGPGCLKILDSLAKEAGYVRNKEVTPEFYEKPITKDNTDTNVKHD